MIITYFTPTTLPAAAGRFGLRIWRGGQRSAAAECLCRRGEDHRMGCSSHWEDPLVWSGENDG